MKTVDVVIAARDEAPYLAQCLESLHAQDYPPDLVRILVVDNSSTDGTAEVARRHGARVLDEPRPGAAGARNRGIAAGTGDLVAFLDAHCSVGRGWIGALASRFAEPDVGACQAKIVNRAVDPRVQTWLDRTGELSNERILDDTVHGRRNLYPWILSGNSMYRRHALQAAGPFDPGFEACEDVDLAWRVLLLGYRLDYAPETEAVHYETRPWSAFVRKGYRYGRGAAQLAWAYREHGSKRFVPRLVPSQIPREKLKQTLYYWLGFRWKTLHMQLGIARPPRPRTPARVHEDLRRPFAWTVDTTLCVSRDVVHWSCESRRVVAATEPAADGESILVHVPRRQRYVLQDVGGFIWTCIAAGESRQQIARRISDRYSIALRTSEVDLDELVESLVHEGLVVRARSARNSA